MPVPTALSRFMEARSAIAERASSPSAEMQPSGVEISLYLTELLDRALVELATLYTHAQEPTGFAVVAVGGYGRRELARHSDVDVMILIDGHDDPDHLTRLLYPLWDANLKVGHSLRTLPQVVESARANVETFTSILDARLVAGDAAVFGRFQRSRRDLVRRSRGWMLGELRTRHEALMHAQAWQVQAIDLKTGRGGLRDLHALHWLAEADAIAEEKTAPPLPEHLAEAREFILKSRHAVHSTTERPSDIFRPELIGEMARWLQADGFGWSRDLYAYMRVVDAALCEALQPSESLRRFPWPKRRGISSPPIEDPSNVAALRAALRTITPGGPLEPLPARPWLQRLLPEWESIRSRPHVAPFHIHPVDVHSVRAVAEVQAILVEDEYDAGAPEVARAFGRTDELLLAALLHDIGKGYAGVEHPDAGAVIVERFAARAGLPAQEAARLVAAVRHHLLLPAVATRRDIADPEVIRETAATVGDLATLRLLYVLSIADARASGPNVWNQWKAQLMRALFQRVSVVLQAAEVHSVDALDGGPGTLVVAAEAALVGRFTIAEVRHHLEGLEQGYLVSTTPQAIGDHIELIREASRNGGAAARRDRLGAIDRLTLVCPDRPGLLQDIAGTMAGFSVNMLGGVAYTRADGVAIEVWHVSDALGVGIDDRRWGRILKALPAAARGEYDVADRLEEVRRSYPQPPRREDIETKVHLDNRASRDYSVLEISAPDRRGLLYAVTNALHDLRINIHLAKVDTIGPEVFDAFYIQRENGSRIEEPDEIERLERRVEAVLAELD